MIKGCIFDLDGTLADTLESIARGINYALKQLGLRPRPVEEFKFYAGDGLDMALKRALWAAGDQEGKYTEEGISAARVFFGDHPLYKVKPYPGIVDTLNILKKQGMRLAVLSNKPHEAAVHIVTTLFGQECFDKIQGQSDWLPKKPDPTGALAIAAAFGLKPEEILYLGDTNTDMKTGISAGMYTVGVSWGFRPRKELMENHAMKIIDAPGQILDILEASANEQN